jgi:drug/metabolite transporter (DMT)-like permease
MRAPARDWAALLGLVALWGSSYVLVEIALTGLAPRQVAGLRIMTGALVLLVALLASRERVPGGRRFWPLALAIALLGNCVPFLLISWGQVRLESGLAGILAATTPLCVLVLSHFVLHDEQLERRQLLAFALAFAGVIVLMGGEALSGLGGSGGRLWAQGAVLAAAACYALATVLARLVPGRQPVATSAVVMTLAAAVMVPVTLPGLPPVGELPGPVLLAVGALGVLGTGLASVLYFRLVADAGARFVSLLNYLVPVWATVLGAFWLDERLPVSAWAALLLILVGILVTQR